MKGFCTIVGFALALLTVLPAYAQNNNSTQNKRRSPEVSTGERKKEEVPNTMPGVTVRAQNMNEQSIQQIGNARWMRIIYRNLDLTKEANAPLYYPVHPMNNQMNLFSLIFNLISEDKITAYEYIDGYEDFSAAHEVVMKDMLDRFHIFYEETPAKGKTPASFTINESDIPSEDVKAYYVKEAWYFDQNNSVFDVKTLAICPILTSSGDIGEQTMAMFWIPYENIRPYLITEHIMTSNINNASLFTMDDYFRRRMFQGEIIKTQNLMNQPLQAYCPTPDSLKREQDRIENQLVGFEKSLWLQPDTTQNVTNDKSKKVKQRVTTARGNSSKSSGSKTKAAKTQKSSPVRSIRTRR